MSNRVGRRQKPGARYPGGQLKDEPDARQQEKNMSVAVEARQRIHGLTAKQAATQEGGTAIGRLLIGGILATGQQVKDFKEAADCFLERRSAYEGAMQFARLTTSTDYTGDRRGTAGGQGDEPSYVDWSNRSRARYAEIRRAILEADPLAMTMLEQVLLNDLPPKSQETMGAFRAGLNAVHRVLRNECRTA